MSQNLAMYKQKTGFFTKTSEALELKTSIFRISIKFWFRKHPQTFWPRRLNKTPVALVLETALLKVVNDLSLSHKKGNISVLALLDFSSAFDTIDHPILVHRLHTDFGFTDAVLRWFSSYMTDRTHYVSLSNHCSAFAPVHSGVPQG